MYNKSKYEWLERNREEVNKRRRERYKANKQEILLSNKEYRDNNKDKIKELSRKYYETHKQEIIERNNKWKEQNRDKVYNISKKCLDKTCEELGILYYHYHMFGPVLLKENEDILKICQNYKKLKDYLEKNN